MNWKQPKTLLILISTSIILMVLIVFFIQGKLHVGTKKIVGENKMLFVEVALQSGITFVNEGSFVKTIIDDVSLNDRNADNMTGGVSVVDINNDGWDDIYFSSIHHDALYINKKNFRFEDQTDIWDVPENPLGAGALFGDINNDGLIDLFVYNREGANELYLNQGNRFEKVVYDSSLFDPMHTFGAAFADYDRDGDLDLYVVNYGSFNTNLPMPNKDNINGERDILYNNDGNGVFTEVQNGINDKNRWGLGVGFADLNNDGWQDLYIVNDFGQDQLYINEQGTFRDVTEKALTLETSHGMNISFGDIDQDGLLDMFVTNIFGDPEFMDDGNFLWHNIGGLQFTNMSHELGVNDGGWGWGGVMADFDNDSDIDIFHVNGFDDGILEEPILEFSKLFLNGIDQFDEVAEILGVREQKGGRGVAYADFDRDGGIDIVVNNIGNRPSLFRNQSIDTNWIGFELKTQLLPAAGARVELKLDDKTLIREIGIGSNYLSQNTSLIHFGLGEANESNIKEVIIRWPNGTTTTVENPKLQTYNMVVQKGF